MAIVWLSVRLTTNHPRFVKRCPRRRKWYVNHGWFPFVECVFQCVLVYFTHYCRTIGTETNDKASIERDLSINDLPYDLPSKVCGLWKNDIKILPENISSTVTNWRINNGRNKLPWTKIANSFRGEAFTYKSKLHRGGRCCVMRFSRETNSSNRENLFAWKRRSLSKKKKRKETPRYLWSNSEKFLSNVGERINYFSRVWRERRTEVTDGIAYRVCISAVSNRKKNLYIRRAYVVSNVLELN